MLAAETEHLRAQTLLLLEATRTTRRSWRAGMTPDFDASWRRVKPAVEAVTRSTMVGSAQNASRLVPRQLTQAGHAVRPVATVVPEVFGTQTMLGVDVATALDSTTIRAKQAVARGATPQQALEIGEEWLEQLLRSVAADVNRAAQQALVTATPRMGWVRVVPTPCCPRCAILSGVWYRYSSGFQRHPQCDCFHRPAPQDMSGTSDIPSPEDLYADGAIKGLSEVERQAIDDGADLLAVVRSQRGRAAGGMTTVEGTSRRGAFGRNNRGRVRLTPRAIYAQADGNRAQAVELLQEYGYLRVP